MNSVLCVTPELINAMIEISFQRRWFQTAVSCIKFSQCMVQALWNDNSLLQLPHLTEQELKYVARNSKSQSKILADYLKVPDEEKKGLAHFTEEQKQDVFQTCRILPQLSIETKLFVEEDEEGPGISDDDDNDNSTSVVKSTSRQEVDGNAIYEGDIVTLRVTMTRLNVAEGDECPPVYAPRYPRILRESWWFVLSDVPKAEGRNAAPQQARIHACERNNSQKRVVVHELHFQAPPTAGSYVMDLSILSDCYIGLDEELSIKFDVLPAADLPEYQPHPEDAQLDNDATVFESMLTSNLDEGSSDEEDNKATTNAEDSSDEDSVEND